MEHATVSAEAKYSELGAAERPSCQCHDEVMAWNADKLRPAGGKWVCAVGRRESVKRRLATPEGKAVKARNGRLHGWYRQGDQEICYIVLAPEVGRFKIGHTKMKPEARLLTLQTGSPVDLEIVAVLEGGRKTEQRLHERFAAYRVRGEWFDAVVLADVLQEGHNLSSS